MRVPILAATLICIVSVAHAAPSCPGDTTVWVNQSSGVYHLPGDRWYGRTKHGIYECEKAALAEGDKWSGVRMAEHRVRTARHGGRTAKQNASPQSEDAIPAASTGNPF
ncbi:hypothetical protein LDL36_14090 [Komagataeibacter sp. FNDCR1]|nr:hypothetical protein [Komagataeibacter sp. FNDCR1]